MMQTQKGNSEAQHAHLVHFATGRGNERYQFSQLFNKSIDLITPVPFAISSRKPAKHQQIIIVIKANVTQ